MADGTLLSISGSAPIDERLCPIDIQKNSKQAIFSLHRGDLEQAASRLGDAEKAAQELLPLIQGDPSLRHGSFSSSIEEFAEARIFQVFLKEQRLLKSSELQLADRDE